MGYDFGGYATKANVKCTDGRTILPKAFMHMDKSRVPLVWKHGHKNMKDVLGHVDLEARPDGMYAHGVFNETPEGKHARALVEHGDLDSLSIYANKLTESSNKVMHGDIIEVSLVLAGANSGAKIDNVVIRHGDGDVEEMDGEAVISFPDEKLKHGDEMDEDEYDDEDVVEHTSFQDVLDSMNEEQTGLLEFMVSEALKAGTPVSHSEEDDKKNEQDEKDSLQHQEGTVVTRNVFEGNGIVVRDDDRKVLTHDQLATLVKDGRKMGSFKDSFLAHADEYGITNIEMLFPDAQAIDNKPEWITRRMEWVEKVIGETRKLPFSRIKSMAADLTHEEARAKGYIKASMKKEQFFSVTKRVTTPKTVYKKQRLDRDDIIDITEFDVVVWIWVEMRFMLREEIARAILIGDGREIDDEDKINEDHVRPIAHDNEWYTDVATVPANVNGESIVEAVLRARENYKGTAPKAYMTTKVKMDMLLAKDKMGRRLYNTDSDLAAALSVAGIVEVPVMEGVERDGGAILMIIVNLSDYSVGSTRGGEVTEFTDFDIDFNQYKYLIEGRMSGALTKHKTAQVIVRGSGTLVTPTAPTFNPSTGVVTIPNIAGVTYRNQATDAPLSAGAQTALAPGATLDVQATPNTGYFFPHNFDADWGYTRPLA